MKEATEQFCAGMCAALLLGFLAPALCGVTLNIDSKHLQVPKKLS